MSAAFNFCKDSDVKIMVIFTSTGEGPCKALDEYLSQDAFMGIHVIAVSPPVNKQYRGAAGEPVRAGIVGDRFRKLQDAKVPIVSARLPFRSIIAHPDPVTPPPESAGHLIVPPAPNLDTMHAVDRALGIFGGGISLCIQAVLMACDAGAVTLADRVVAMSADTAIVARACQSESFLSPHTGLLIEHIVCRPRIFAISKRHHYLTQTWVDDAMDDAVDDEEGDEEGDEDDEADALLALGTNVRELPPGSDEKD
jgi:hypothetical protein